MSKHKSAQLTKKQIRDKILFKLKTQKEEDRIKKSRRIEEKLFGLSEFRQAHIIMFYLSTEFEVDTLNMIRRAIRLGKLVAVPVISQDNKDMKISLVSGETSELEVGPYSIKQPKAEYRKTISADMLDLAIIPGLAFDEKGMRLGRGKGYYDRFLETKHNKTYTIGLAFDFQIVKDLPCSWHDYPVEQVISA